MFKVVDKERAASVGGRGSLGVCSVETLRAHVSVGDAARHVSTLGVLFFTGADGGDVGSHDGFALAAEDVLDGFFELGELNLQIGSGGAEEDHVAAGVDLLGNLVGVEADALLEFLQLSVDDGHVGIVLDVDEGVAVGDDAAVSGEEGKIAEGFHGLGAENDVGLAFGDDVSIDGLAADAEVGEDAAAALRHAVNFALFDVHAQVEGCVADDLGHGDDTIAAYATKYDVFFHDCSIFLGEL